MTGPITYMRVDPPNTPAREETRHDLEITAKLTSRARGAAAG